MLGNCYLWDSPYKIHLQTYAFEVLPPSFRRRFIFEIYCFTTSSVIARLTVDTLHLLSRAIVLCDGKQYSCLPCRSLKYLYISTTFEETPSLYMVSKSFINNHPLWIKHYFLFFCGKVFLWYWHSIMIFAYIYLSLIL